MTIDIIPKSLYPLVPNAPGVPAVLRSAAQIIDTATGGYLGVGDALNDIIGTDPVKWGIFDSSGAAVAVYDSIMSTGYRNDSRVSDYPVELGGFAAYNKVDSPFDVVVIINCAGSEDKRAAFQVAMEAARRSLQVYAVFTPTATYNNCNVTGLDIRHEAANGANMTIATVTIREIRQTTSVAYADPKGVGAFDPQSQGQIKTVDDPSIDVSGFA